MKKTLCSILTLLTFVTLVFLPDSFAQFGSPEYVVRVIYFLPSDRVPQPDIDEKLDKLIKDTQLFYADQMTAHGFHRKTFRFEADTTGRLVVHRLNGQFNDAYYHSDAWDKVWQEIEGRFHLSNNIWLTMLDVSTEQIDTWCGQGGGSSLGGRALMPASGDCFSVSVAAHELGHAFGLMHDNRVNGRWVESVHTRTQTDRMITSFCSAEWLDVHRYLEINHTLSRDPRSAVETHDPIRVSSAVSSPSDVSHLCGVGALDVDAFFKVNETAPGDALPAFEMLGPPSLTAPPNEIRLRFSVTDADGIHQVRLHTPEWDPYVAGEFLACQKVNTTHATVEFVTTELSPRSESVRLWTIDGRGNFALSERYPINVTPVLPPATTVSIPDPQLAAAVREQIGNITTRSLLNLRVVDGENHPGIRNLTGLESAYNLKYIYNVSQGEITDVSPLANLVGLTGLHLEEHQIQNINPLANLTHLARLHLANNTISNISALASLTYLKELYLDSNTITDISALANLTHLTILRLWNNTISNISALTGLIYLKGLYLDNNTITDISALANLTHLTRLGLGNNTITDISALANLTHLKYLWLWYNNITDVSPLVGLVNLEELYLAGNPIEDLSPLRTLLANNPNLKIDIEVPRPPTALTFTPSTVADQTFTVGEAVRLRLPIATGGTAPYTYTLSPLPAGLSFNATQQELRGTPTTAGTTTTTYTATDAANVSAALTFTIEITGTGADPSVVDIPDPDLRAAIADALGKAPGDAITRADMETLVELRADFGNITDLSGIEFAINLIELYLDFNRISDISPLASLTNLTRLYLSFNRTVRDISPLASLTNLTRLYLDFNQISDISSLSNLTNLTWLGLGNNRILDISPLVSLTNLTWLDLDNNRISDLLPLIAHANLRNLYLSNNRISDISILAGLTNLTTLSLGGNAISDLLPLIAHANLRNLYLQDNEILDISPLANLTNLIILNLGSNTISDISPLANFTSLIRLYIQDNNISDVETLERLMARGTVVYFSGNPAFETPGPKIEEGWVWLLVPATDIFSGADAARSGRDFLSEASGGTVTEAHVARNGAQEGTQVGDSVWTAATLDATDPNNLNTISEAHDAAPVDLDEVPIDSETLQALEDNGWTADGFDVTDPDKRNALIPADTTLERHIRYPVAYGVVPIHSETQQQTRVYIGAAPVKVWLNGTLVYRDTLHWSGDDYETALPVLLNAGNNLLFIAAYRPYPWTQPWGAYFGFQDGTVYTVGSPGPDPLDVNGNGQVNVLDLVLVAAAYGTRGPGHPADVNADGIVNIQDLIAVAAAIDASGAALPQALKEAVLAAAAEVEAIEAIAEAPRGFRRHQHALSLRLTYENVADALADAKALGTGDMRLGKWIPLLEELLQLLAEMGTIPKTTALLPNYPNPFNPETWIPYHLATDAEVTLTIYDVRGSVVRELALGHQAAGVYESRRRAAYWDGKNRHGEKVASGLYFYTLTAGEFTATRKLLIRK